MQIEKADMRMNKYKEYEIWNEKNLRSRNRIIFPSEKKPNK